jgi:para-nitrobenzyl esterase
VRQLRFALLGGFLLLAANVTAAPRVEVRGTLIDGVWSAQDPAVAEFRGVPYAQPPVGVRRFRPPLPWLPEPGIRSAKTFAPGCVQDDYNTRWYRQVGAYFGAAAERFVDPPFSEDCLYLNIWSPHPDPSARLPVLVWFHGGSNKAGWSFEANYQGARLAARGRILVVTVGYRLGAFGFMATSDGHQVLANAGLSDQIEALRYVRRSIAAFGGDPARVTIAGESAGGADVLALLAAPAARGLYARAIIESGGYSLRGAPTLEQAQAALQQVADTVQAPTLAQLQAVPALTLFAASAHAKPAPRYLPVVDGQVLTETVTARLRRGLDVDVLVGSNADESLLYVDDREESLQRLVGSVPATVQPELDAWSREAGAARAAQNRLGSFLDMGCSAQVVAAAVKPSHRAYLYRFIRVRSGAADAGLGAYHGAEIPYVFDTHDDWLPTDAVDRALGEQMLSAWAAFVATGDPNRSGRPHWPVFRAEAPQALELGDTVRTIEAPDHARCDRVAPVIYPLH